MQILLVTKCSSGFSLPVCFFFVKTRCQSDEGQVAMDLLTNRGRTGMKS